MYKIYYSSRARQILEWYFSSFKQYYITLYSDTGIFSEDTIRTQYISTADSLFAIIDTHIMKKLQGDIVFWRKITDISLNQYTLITSIQNRTLIIDYTEDISTETRIITGLRIFRE